MAGLYPPIEPYESGLLAVGEGNAVYWETCGNAEGQAALVVHGGPGSGCSTDARRYFDPARYRVVLVDQRNCGRSRPHASDPAVDLATNTTDRLIADFERVREHLAIDRWVLRGYSWGSTLALAYAEWHPERVSALVLSAVTTTRRAEIEWLYRGVGRFFPEAWERFRAFAGVDPDGDVVAAYARLVEETDPDVRATAVREWCAWEDAVLSGETQGEAKVYGGRPGPAQTALVRICAHYFTHAAWLAEGQLIEEADRLTGIPGVLVQGRFDLAGPPRTAWQLANVWPDATLRIVDDVGHLGNQRTKDFILTSLNDLAQ
jgi:proline iminopeptidase